VIPAPSDAAVRMFAEVLRAEVRAWRTVDIICYQQLGGAI
jgi:hypothetical protein